MGRVAGWTAWPLAGAARLLSFHYYLPLLIVAMIETGVDGRVPLLGALAETLPSDAAADALPHRVYGVFHLLSYGGMIVGGVAIDRLRRGGVSLLYVLAGAGFSFALGAGLLTQPATLAPGLLALASSRAVLEPALLVFVLERSRPTRAPAVLGLYGAQNAGMLAAAFGTARLAQLGGWPAAFAIVAALVIVTSGLALRGDDAPTDRPAAEAPTSRSLGPALAALCIGAVAFSAHLFHCLTLGESLAEGRAAPLLLFGHVVSSRLLLQLPVNAAATVVFCAGLAFAVRGRSVDPRRFVAAGLAVMASGLAALAISAAPASLLLSTLLLSLGEALVGPFLLLWLARVAPAHHLALALAAMLLARDFLSDFGGGALVASGAAPAAVGGLLVLTSGVVVGLIVRTTESGDD